MGTIDFSGFGNIAQAVGGFGSTVANIGMQEQVKQQNILEQAKQYRFTAEAQKRDVELQGFVQSKLNEMNNNWASPDYDREGAPEALMADIQEYYDINIRSVFDDNQAAQFEAGYLYPILGYTQEQVNTKIAGFEINAGKQANLYTLNSVPDLIASGANPSVTVGNALTAIDQLRQVGHYMTDVEAEDAKKTLVDSANLITVEMALTNLVRGSDMTPDEAELLVDAITKRTPEVAGRFSDKAREILGLLSQYDDLDTFDFYTAEEIKANTRSASINKQTSQNNQVIDEVSKIVYELGTLAAEDTLTVANVTEAFKGRTDTYSRRAKAEQLDIAKKLEDTRLARGLDDDAFAVRDGGLTVDEFENDPRWNMFHDKPAARAMKEEYIGVAKNNYDVKIQTDMLNKYNELIGKDDTEAARDMLYSGDGGEYARIITKGGGISNEDRKIIEGMYDKEASSTLISSIEGGFAQVELEKLEAKQAEMKERIHYSLNSMIMKGNQREAVERAAIADAFRKGLITPEEADKFESRIGRFGPDKEIDTLVNGIQLYAEQRFPEDITQQKALYNRVVSAFWNELESSDNDTIEYAREVAAGMTQLDNAYLEFLHYEYGQGGYEWSIGDGSEGDTFGKFINMLYDQNLKNSSAVVNDAYNMAIEAGSEKVRSEFGDKQYQVIYDDYGPMWLLDGVDEKITSAMEQAGVVIPEGVGLEDVSVMVQYAPYEEGGRNDTVMDLVFLMQETDGEGNALGGPITKRIEYKPTMQAGVFKDTAGTGAEFVQKAIRDRSYSGESQEEIASFLEDIGLAPEFIDQQFYQVSKTRPMASSRDRTTGYDGYQWFTAPLQVMAAEEDVENKEAKVGGYQWMTGEQKKLISEPEPEQLSLDDLRFEIGKSVEIGRTLGKSDDEIFAAIRITFKDYPNKREVWDVFESLVRKKTNQTDQSDRNIKIESLK